VLLVVLASCSEGGVKITPVSQQPATPERTATRMARATPAPTPRLPAIAVQSFRPAGGYTSMIADRRGVYWLGGGVPLQAVVMGAAQTGEGERVLARPLRDGEAVGRPLPAGEWLLFPETQDTNAAGGPWRVRAVHLSSGRERIVDGAQDGWDGLSLAVAGARAAYTVGVGSGVEVASEVRLWDTGTEEPRTVLRTAPGVTLQRIAFDGRAAAAVRTTRLPDGAVATDVVELDLSAGRLLPLPAQNATMPGIAPRWIVWVTIPVGGTANQLVLFDRERRTTRVIADSGQGHSLHNPSISGNLVTWNSSDTSAIALYDAEQRAGFVIDQGVVGKVWIHEGVLVWTALNAATRAYELKVGTLSLTP